MKIDAIIPAGGKGSRFAKNEKKQFYKINGNEIIYYTIKNLNNSYNFNKFIIGVLDEDINVITDILNRIGIKNFILTKAGEVRHQTVFNGLLKSDTDLVLIHDAVRPIITGEIVNNVINMAKNYDGVICGIKLKDALKEVNVDNTIKLSVDRNKYILVHTPQVFKREVLRLALDSIEKKHKIIYDEAEALEYIEKKVIYVDSEPYNIKITFKEDIPLAKFLMKSYLSEQF